MLKELIPPIKDRVIFKKELASKNVICVRSSSPMLNSCNELLVHLLKAKFKQVRRPLLNDEQVAKFKIKYSRINSGHKRNSVLLNESVNLCSAKRHCHHSSDKNVDDGITQHIIKSMTNECQKLRPDIEFLAHQIILSIEALKYTCRNERTLDVLNKFPALYYEKFESGLCSIFLYLYCSFNVVLKLQLS
ncbi:uncharacterized protein LOC105845102 isoform X2 [Hydra vulgaris]|uniref:uncharacterized protein LOC105845102 isoform X2 n=1 Tax=Hydra vulgaris TaxID=6087 RepID=UPI0032EA5D70